MINPALFSSNTDLWATPQWVFDRVNAVFNFQTDVHAVAKPVDFRNMRYGDGDGDVSGTMQSKASGRYSLNYQTGIQQDMQVRRLTPLECERLQGFPDNYTKLSDKTKDGPRYQALGNSMAVPVMHWLGQRIQMVESMKVST